MYRPLFRWVKARVKHYWDQPQAARAPTKASEKAKTRQGGRPEDPHCVSMSALCSHMPPILQVCRGPGKFSDFSPGPWEREGMGRSTRACWAGAWGLSTRRVASGHGGRAQRRAEGRRVTLLPEHEVSAVYLSPAAAVLQDASIAHHGTLLKLGPVIGHVLGEGRGRHSGRRQRPVPALLWHAHLATKPTPTSSGPTGWPCGESGRQKLFHSTDEKRPRNVLSYKVISEGAGTRTRSPQPFLKRPGRPQVSREKGVTVLKPLVLPMLGRSSSS